MRKQPRKDYKSLADVKLPKAKHVRQGGASTRGLYPVEIVDEDDSQYKVHYIGYSNSYGEWKTCEELVRLDSTKSSAPDSIIEQFSLYKELAHRIKATLKSTRKESPMVKIEMPFDFVSFCGGLQQYGVKKRFIRGSQRYCIKSYNALDQLLDSNWHVRGLNRNGDFCYAILNTIEFYLYHRRPLKEYIPMPDGQPPVEVARELGHVLVFSFVRGDGTPEDFGKDTSVFS